MFYVILLCWCSWSLMVFGLESVSVTEGESVTLYMNITERQRKEGISWKFGANINIDKSLIAEIKSGNNEIKLHKDRPDERFNNRLKLDQTGSLTITNTTITHSGLYQITTSKNKTLLNKTFNITVYTRLPVPVITSVSSQNSSLSLVSNCSVLCSVMNVSHVSLSWYKRNRLLSSIIVSDHSNINISLHLECLDDSYTCVLNNHITNQTQHLNTDVCHKCSGVLEDNFCTCGLTEAVIRLVISALVGVATVAALVYDIKSRGDEQKKMRSDTQSK
ncbi:uncharacterized protein LOC130429465 isoform X2 [Triplophysa dalaica]|uniref:uncharacterized protein LOC130429465 isoform X2 n=1 Tax=Triplophysa dalaica TaxID=1582913 RepID=UPI0024DFD347|nr:uncharacterized protein LOC130429465 isoform X2 [Triplophysa dalaica]